MTLLIAWLLMEHVGIVSPWAYFGVVILWLFHVGHHS